MNSKILRALAIALLVGVAGSAASVGVIDSAYAQATIKNKAVGKPLQDALDAAKVGNAKLALEKAQEADKVPGKTAEETSIVHQYVAAFAMAVGDKETALAMLDKMIAAGEGDKQKNLTNAMALALQLKNNDKAQGYLKQMGGGAAGTILMAKAQGQAGDYKECLRLAEPLAATGQPSKDLLETLAFCYSKSGDQDKLRDMREKLTMYYPTPQYWHDLLVLAKNEKGQADAQKLDLERIRMLVGDIKTSQDYTGMAQIALIAGYPAEAKDILDKATKAKVLSAGAGDRDQRLINMANDRLAKDQANLPTLQKQAASDATGNASLKLGLDYLSYGKAKEADDAIRDAMKKGQLTDADAAKVALGRALLAQNKKPDATTQFSSVSKGSKWTTVARLWSIYARH